MRPSRLRVFFSHSTVFDRRRMGAEANPFSCREVSNSWQRLSKSSVDGGSESWK